MNAATIATWTGIVWPIASGLFNTVIRWKTDAQWVEFCERTPKLAGLVKFVRAAGLDPVAVVRAVRHFGEKPASVIPVTHLSMIPPPPVAIDIAAPDRPSEPATPEAKRASLPGDV